MDMKKRREIKKSLMNVDRKEGNKMEVMSEEINNPSN
jgi:hypothetical protein